MRPFTFAGAALVTVLVAAVTPARGAGKGHPEQTAPPPADVDTAERFYGNLDYELANRVADRVVQQHGLTHDQLVRAYRILALTASILDRADDAREAFVQLLTYSPDFQIDPNLSPKVSAPFLEARGFWRGQTSKPGLEVTSAARPNEVATLRITTHDPTHIAEAVLVGFRWGSNSAYISKPATIGENVLVETSPPPTGSTRLDYYVQAVDKHDNIIFEIGNPNSPKSVTLQAPPAPPPPPPAEKRSIFANPTFWGVVGGVLVVGGVTTFLVLRPKQPGNASLGSGVECGGQACQ